MYQPMMSGLVIDNFAGGGGASSGIEEAFGRPVDVAINHDAEAIAMHAANHPNTVHICENVWQAIPEVVTGGKHVALAWFSPDCKHFSKAKGGRPKEKNIRGLAWVVVLWAQRTKPDVIMLENVEEFRQWCELDDNGQPIADAEQLSLLPEPELVRKGKRKPLKPNGHTFELWLAGLKREGYQVEWKELRGCDYGAPTIRKRLFVIARRDGRPIVWPAPTHGRRDNPAVLAGELCPWRTAAECIDWSIPTPSIFERVANGRPDLAENTKRRIAAGIVRFVLNNPQPFIVPVCNSGWNPDAAHPGDEPMRTVTTAKGGEFAVVTPYIMTNNTNNAPQPIDDQGVPTVTTGNRNYLVTPILDRQFTKGAAAAADAPAPTETERQHTALLTPILVHTAHGEKTKGPRRKGGRSRGRGSIPLEESLPTTTSKGNIALVSATMIGAGGAEYAGKPRPADEPLGTATVHDRRALVTAFMAQHNSPKGEQVRAGRPATEPASTIVHRGTQQGVVVAHIEQANTGMVGHEPEKPLSTIVEKGCTQRVVTSHLMKYRGTSRHGAPTDEPAPTVTSGGEKGGIHIAEVRAFLLKYYGTGAIGSELGGPMHSATSHDRFGLITVTIGGEEYVIVDIGMRMLTARELARAQGFPDSYILDPWVDGVTKRGKPRRYRLPKTAQVRMIGNSVNRQVARALVAANCNVPVANEEAQAA